MTIRWPPRRWLRSIRHACMTVATWSSRSPGPASTLKCRLTCGCFDARCA